MTHEASLHGLRESDCISADLSLGVQPCSNARSCLDGRLLSASPLISLFDPQLTFGCSAN